MKNCGECGGGGRVADHSPSCWGNCAEAGCPIVAPCENCRGMGKVEEEHDTEPSEGEAF